MESLGVLEKAVKIVDKYGWWKVLQTIFSVGLFLFFIYYIPATTKATVEKTTIETLQTVNKGKEEEHLKNVEIRREIQPKIEAILTSLLNETKADRAFIVELHNGSNNINGVPFLHGSVTYETSADGLDAIDEEYQNLSLSRFEMSSYLHNNFEFIGSVEDVRKIDKKLAAKLASNDVKYVVMSTLHNGTKEWGWFGILYNRLENIPSDKELLSRILITSQSIAKEMNILRSQNE